MKVHQHSFTKYARDINEICRPLFESMPINLFVARRIYKDNKYSGFMSHGVWAEHYLNNAYYNLSSIKHQEELNSDIILWKSAGLFQLDEQTRKLYLDCKEFGFRNGITLVEKHKDYVQLYSFSVNSDSDSINQYLLENLAVLSHFACYFNASVQKSNDLSRVYQKKFKADFNKADLSHSVSAVKSGLSIDVDAFYFGDDLCFSSREIDCLVLSYCGRSAKEVAYQLGLSPRTVESHFNRIKIKSGFSNLAELRWELFKNVNFRQLFFSRI